MASKTSCRRAFRFLAIGSLVATGSLVCLAYAAVTFVKQAASRIVIDGDALGKVIQDAILVTLREGTPEEKLAVIASFADVPADAASYVRPLLTAAAKDSNPEVSRAATKAIERLSPHVSPAPVGVSGGKLMRLPGIAARELMAANATAGVALWLGDTAWRVHRNPEQQIVHRLQDRDSGALSLSGHSLPPSFWSHYRRELLGQPWPGDYPCACRLNADPGKRELASAANSGPLNPLFNRVSGAYRKASGHKGAVENLGKSNAWDEQRVRDLDAQVKELADKGQVMHGAAGVRRAFLRGIAVTRTSLEEHQRLYQIYHAAAISPTLLTDPEIVEPE